MSKGKHLVIVDLEAMFHEVQGPIVLNDLPSDTEEDRDKIRDIIMTTYEHTDIISTVPMCFCKHLKRGYNLGRECPKCNTVVQVPVESKIDLKVWFRVPDNVKGFMLPNIWVYLTHLISGRGYNILEWLTNSNSRLPAKISMASIAKIRYFE